MTIKEARQNAYRQLSEAWEKQKKTAGPYAQKPDFFLDIDVILQELLQVERSFLLANNETKLKQKDIKRFFALIQKRSRGLPIAYIVGKKNFTDSAFVSPHVLIPKPDTEILVEKALGTAARENPAKLAVEKYIANPAACESPRPCTGSGCIALSFAQEFYKTKETAPRTFYERYKPCSS